MEECDNSETPLPERTEEAALRNRSMRRRFLTVALAAAGAGRLSAWSPVMAEPAKPAPLPLAYDFVQSPNCDDRPVGTVISCIVLHSTAVPTTEGTMQIFLDRARKVSAHFVVGRVGRVVQMVPVEKRAWHAGASVLEGVAHVNDFSVGIEMVNLNDGIDSYPDPQMQAVAGILRFLRAHFEIPDHRIVSHAEIAQPPGRKTDPVGFDFEHIRLLARTSADKP